MTNKKKKNREEQEEDTKDSLHKADEAEALPEWEEDPEVYPTDENSEFIKIQENGSLAGDIVDIIPSTSWKGLNIYKIDDGTGVIKVILGTTVLDRQMSTKSIGDWVRILRIMDKPTTKGNPLQRYKTFSKKVKKNASR